MSMITYAPKGILQIDDCHICHRNFAGAQTKYNREGDRNFSVVIDNPDDIDRLSEDGWKVKIRPPKEEGDEPFAYLPVKVKYNGTRGPIVYLTTGKRTIQLTEDTIGMLDEIEIERIDLDIRPYNWEKNGMSGRAAYLQSIDVIQKTNRFAERHMGGFSDDRDE